MGNRATVIFWNGEREAPERQCFSPAIYLHWNGGPESIYAFLAELDRREIRADQDYEAARFVQLVGEFFDCSGDKPSRGGLSLGIANGPARDWISELERVSTDHSDNGFYLVDRTKTPFAMRRFTERSYDADRKYEHGEYLEGFGQSEIYRLCEWSPEAVEAERLEAERSDHIDGIGSFFRELDEKVSTKIDALG